MIQNYFIQNIFWLNFLWKLKQEWSTIPKFVRGLNFMTMLYVFDNYNFCAEYGDQTQKSS